MWPDRFRESLIAILTTALALSGAALFLSLLSAQAATGGQPAAAPQAPVLTATRPTPETVSAIFLPYTTWQPTPVPTAVPPPEWLTYLNRFRAAADLHPLTENSTWSYGSWLHSRYMVKEDAITHGEDPSSEWYTEEGDIAGRKGNIAVSWSVYARNAFAIDLWMSGPFHAIRILDPRLYETGFGSYREEIGYWKMAATLDVSRGRGELPADITYPIFFPADGGATWLPGHVYGEFPDPLAHCGYTRPAGAPLLMQLGTGSLSPEVITHSFRSTATELEHCVFSESTYTHTVTWQQNSGRRLLDGRDAIVLMPREMLEVGKSYTASITISGTAPITYSWSFSVTTPPAAYRPSPAIEAIIGEQK
ncbi:MAG: CAP domain-containing protein [Candidatus Promineifilaceae bacterium]|nr:CAP domain-containing protein [Candidatus Promineifilaceae bacterium]